MAPDAICAPEFSNDAPQSVCPSNAIPVDLEGLDAGPEAQKLFAEAIKGCKTILWNGPAGVFEFDNFCDGSRAIGNAIAEATAEGAFSLIGGGDSVACVNKFGSVSEGNNTSSYGEFSHSSGVGTIARGSYSSTDGFYTVSKN